MKPIYRKIQLLALITVFGLSTAVQAQVRTSYFMKTSSARTAINPALRPDQGYFGFPFLNNMYISGMTNTFMLENFLYPDKGTPVPTFMHEAVTYDEFIKNISDNNYVSMDVAYDLFSAGWYSGEGFWSLNLGIKAHSDFNAPKSFFNFLKKGFSDSEPPRTYNMKDTRFIANSYAELGLGYSRSFMDDNLLLGLKGKVLFGLGDVDANITDFSITGSAEEWRASSRATLNASAPGIYATYDDEDGTFDNLEFDEDEIAIPGYGLGFDIGAAYSLQGITDFVPSGMVSDILDRCHVSASLTDIGFISWSKKNSVVLEAKTLEPIVINPNSNTNPIGEGTSLVDQLDDAVNDLENALDFQPSNGTDGSESRTTSLRMTMNWGLEYEVTNMISVGLLSSTFFNHSHNQTELTLSGNFAPLEWLATSVSYSFMHSQFDTFGFALHLAPSKGMKFFIASDYVIPHVNSQFIPTSSKGVNMQFGLAIPLGARR